MTNQIFACTYGNFEAFLVSKSRGLLGFSTSNTGMIGSLQKLRRGDFVLLRDSRQNSYLSFFGLFRVTEQMYEVEGTGERVWPSEVEADEVIFARRVPVKFVSDVSRTISKTDLLALGWTKRYSPFNKYDWSGYMRLFAGSILDDNQAEQINALLRLGTNSELMPQAVDLQGNPDPLRELSEIYRILRDTPLARDVKRLHNYICQVCRKPPIMLRDGRPYAEAHHIRPVGTPHNGPDISENILCVCPCCHVKLDYGVIELSIGDIQESLEHQVGLAFVSYHNEEVCKCEGVYPGNVTCSGGTDAHG